METGEVELGQGSNNQWEDSSDTGVEPGQNSSGAGETRTEGDMEDEEGINPTLRTKYVDQPERNTGWIRDLPVKINGDLPTGLGALPTQEQII